VRWVATYATEAKTGRFDISTRAYSTNSRRHVELDLLASGIEILRFHGFGNEVEAPGDDAYYRVKQARYQIYPRLVVPLGGGELALGPTLRYADTELTPGRIIEATVPYGAGNFGEVGLRVEALWDTRDERAFATRGVMLRVGGAYVPAVWDVTQAFGVAQVEGSCYFGAQSAPLAPVLALRAGGKRVWGTYPFHEAAYIGDQRTVRLGRQNRYGGDAAVWANAEVRMRLGRVELVVPTTIGVFGLGDVGRVYLEGETSERWHAAAGGGAWLSFFRPGNTLTVALAQSEERLGVYLAMGFAY
jgi:hypothetical protein